MLSGGILGLIGVFICNVSFSQLMCACTDGQSGHVETEVPRTTNQEDGLSCCYSHEETCSLSTVQGVYSILQCIILTICLNVM